MPRKFMEETGLSNLSSSMILISQDGLPKTITWDLSGFKDNLLAFNHSVTLQSSLEMVEDGSEFLSKLKRIVVSSAKIKNLAAELQTMSLIYVRKRTGPRIEP